MSATESIAVVVVTFNSAPLLKDLVTSLPAGLAGVDFELIFADNGSHDGSIAEARRLAPGATVVELGRNAGYAGGINAGVAAAGAHTGILILNPDVRLAPGCIAELLSALREPGTGLAVPRLLDARGKLIPSMRREPTVLRALGDAVLGAERAGRYPAIGEVATSSSLYEHENVTDWAEGSTQLISAECWQRCGPWDESFFLYSEETDFGLRARDAGFATRYVPTALATHLEGGSAGSSSLWPLLVTNRVRLFRRRHRLPATILFWLVTLIREGSRAALGRPSNRAAVRALTSPSRMRERPGPHSIAPR